MPSAAMKLRFALNVPPHKLLARMRLWLKRRLLQTFRATSSQPTLASHDMVLCAPLPMPLFRPRQSAVALGGGAFQLTFLQTPRTFSLPFEWHKLDIAKGHHLWQFNLHYHEFLENLCDADFLAIVDDWIRLNSCRQKNYWAVGWSAYALSIRVVVWMQEIARRGLAQEPTIRDLAIPSLVAQIRFLENNLELDICGNHLIKNIKALVWASAFFEGAEAQRYRSRGLSLLRHELGQILADGLHDERSPSYHCQVFADLIEMRHALGHDPFEGLLDDHLQRMADALQAVTHPDGKVALFNDAGLTMAYQPAECLDVYAAVCATQRPPDATAGAFALPDAGYYGFRSQEAFVIIDCGLIAPDDLPAHGHGDVLSVELSWGGLRFVVDQGVYEYNAGPRRNAARSATSHNTLCIEGSDQAEFFGSFRVGQRPHPRVERWVGDGGSCAFAGRLDGFVGLPASLSHRRELEASPRRVMIVDTVDGLAGRTASVRWLLHPEVVATPTEKGLMLVRGDVALALTIDCPFSVESAVWWPDMGLEMATSRIIARFAPDAGSATFVFSPAEPL